MLIAIALVLGILGPFGTYAMPTGIRLLYWISSGLIGYCFFRPVTFVANWLAVASPLPVWLCIAISAAVASLPMTYLIGITIYGVNNITSPQFNAYFPILYSQVAGIGIGVFLLMRSLFKRSEVPESATSTDGMAAFAQPEIPSQAPQKAIATAPITALHERLSKGFPPAIIALGVEDHYVRVYAVQEDKLHSEMLLLRLSDAIKEAAPIDGEQTHRSWWAARAGVAETLRDGRNIKLALKGGLEVPVSRAHAPRLKAAGWF